MTFGVALGWRTWDLTSRNSVRALLRYVLSSFSPGLDGFVASRATVCGSSPKSDLNSCRDESNGESRFELLLVVRGSGAYVPTRITFT